MKNTILQEMTIQDLPSPSVGQILKNARLARGLNLEQVSKSLFISQRQLSHLENDAEHLVCDVYTLGFVKLYAQYLELNAQDITDKFKVQFVHHARSSELVFPAPLPGRGMPSFRILSLSFFALVALVVGWKWLNNYAVAPYPDPEMRIERDEPIATIQVEEPVSLPLQHMEEPAPPLGEEVVSTPIVPAEPDPTPQQVNLHVTEEAWIEVKDTEGNIIISKNFQPGESFEFKNSNDLILKTGNLKGTHLSSNEKIFPNSGKSGEVGRDIPLNPEKWLEQQPETH